MSYKSGLFLIKPLAVKIGLIRGERRDDEFLTFLFVQLIMLEQIYDYMAERPLRGD
jgi:hypothetical protein